MATYHKTLQLMATKLGLGEDEKVLRKAAEFQRLLQAKSITSSNISDTGKIMICLDLAAAVYGADFDVKTAMKYSGLRSQLYTSSKKMVENLLDMNNDSLSIATLCVSLQCGDDVRTLAENILDGYRKQAKIDVDLKLPQYVCMAVYQACRLSKVKVPKNKLIEKSRLKPSQWSKLDADWTKFVDETFTTVKKKRGPPAKSVAETDEDIMEIDLPPKPEERPLEPEEEPYEVWKRRILDSAYKKLNELKLKETKDTEHQEGAPGVHQGATPRRSPRKTPQKNMSNRSPTKSGTVRLLFPV